MRPVVYVSLIVLSDFFAKQLCPRDRPTHLYINPPLCIQTKYINGIAAQDLIYIFLLLGRLSTFTLLVSLVNPFSLSTMHLCPIYQPTCLSTDKIYRRNSCVGYDLHFLISYFILGLLSTFTLLVSLVNPF